MKTRIFLCTILASMACAAAPFSSAAQQLPDSGTQTVVTHGALWESGNLVSSTLVLANSDRNTAARVAVTLLDSNGQPLQARTIDVPANSTSRSQLAASLSSDASLHWGGLSLRISGPVSAVQGKVMINNSRNQSSISLPLLGGYTFDTDNALYASWWQTEPGADPTVSLFNSGSQLISVAPALATPGQRAAPAAPIILAAGETRQVPLSLLAHGQDLSTGTLILRYSGSPHSLLPALLLNGSRGSLAFPFAGLHTTGDSSGASTWVFPQVAMQGPSQGSSSAGAGLAVYALLSNPGQSAAAPQLTAYYGMADRSSKSVGLPVQALAPGEARLVDLASALHAQGVPPSASSIALSITHSGSPGQLGLHVFSIDTSERTMFSAAAAVLPGPAPAMTFWDVKNMVGVFPQAQGAAGLAGSRIALHYQTPFGVASHILGALGGNGSALQGTTLSIRQEMQSGIPDEFGNRILSGVESGLMTLSPTPSADISPECQGPCGTLSAVAPRASSSSTSSLLSTVSLKTNSAEACPAACDMSLTRDSQTQLTGRATLFGGEFGLAAALLSGSTGASISTPNTFDNPNTFTLTPPTSPSSKGAPSPGGLAEYEVQYACSDGGFSPIHAFDNATFGLSCYILSLQSDWGPATACKSLTLKGTVYSGTQVNPTGLPAGTYCRSFLADTRLQGSGMMTNGTKIHYVSGTSPTWVFKTITAFNGADGTALVANQTVARDRHIIGRNESVTLSSKGTFKANDTGGAIKQYRIDIFGGFGHAACSSFINIMSLGNCSPGISTCTAQVTNP